MCVNHVMMPVQVETDINQVDFKLEKYKERKGHPIPQIRGVDPMLL